MVTNSKFSFVILTGGESKRFIKIENIHKAKYEYEGKSMVEHITSKTVEFNFPTYFSVKSKEQAASLKPNSMKFEENLVLDDTSLQIQGPKKGILSAVKKIKSDYIIFLPVDHPFMNKQIIATLTDKIQEPVEMVSYMLSNGVITSSLMAIDRKLFMRKYDDYISIHDNRMSSLFRGSYATGLVKPDLSHQVLFTNINTSFPDDIVLEVVKQFKEIPFQSEFEVIRPGRFYWSYQKMMKIEAISSDIKKKKLLEEKSIWSEYYIADHIQSDIAKLS